jgi:hypothetical protein
MRGDKFPKKIYYRYSLRCASLSNTFIKMGLFIEISNPVTFYLRMKATRRS